MRILKSIMALAMSATMLVGSNLASTPTDKRSSDAISLGQEEPVLPRSTGLVVEEKKEVTTTQVATTAKPTTTAPPAKSYYNIPLSHELQDWVEHIVDLVRELVENDGLIADGGRIITSLPKEFDKEFVFANCRAESTYRRTLVNKDSNCSGYLQLTPKYFDMYYSMTTKQLGIKLEKDIFNAKTNLAVGIFWMAAGFHPDKVKRIDGKRYADPLTAEKIIIAYANGPWGKKNVWSDGTSQKRMRFRQELLDGTYPTKYY